jgi:hypothetical protein
MLGARRRRRRTLRFGRVCAQPSDDRAQLGFRTSGINAAVREGFGPLASDLLAWLAGGGSVAVSQWCEPMITIRKIIRGLTAAMPVWLVVICGVCLAIPLARLAALVCTAGLCLIQPARFRRAVSAWKGGKSHRAFDLARLSALVTPASLPQPSQGLNKVLLGRSTW